MTFIEFYASLSPVPPKTLWVKKIAEATKKSEMTVRGWLTGRCAPDQLTQSIIADILGIPASDLFPKN